MRIRLQVAMGQIATPAGASRTGPVTLARLQSSALREWDRLVGALATARRDPRRLGPWTVQVVRLAAKIVVVALLPFLALIRVAVFLYEHEGWPTVLALRPEDYKTMGLPPNDGSLHLVQRDGYAHAADLRTGGRGFLSNRLLQLYLWGLGFSTLRHTGTSDHLHVELPVR